MWFIWVKLQEPHMHSTNGSSDLTLRETRVGGAVTEALLLLRESDMAQGRDFIFLFVIRRK